MLSVQCQAFSSEGANSLNISQSQFPSLPLTCFFLIYWMQDNLKDKPSSLLSCQCGTFNVIPSEKNN